MSNFRIVFIIYNEDKQTFDTYWQFKRNYNLSLDKQNGFIELKQEVSNVKAGAHAFIKFNSKFNILMAVCICEIIKIDNKEKIKRIIGYPNNLADRSLMYWQERKIMNQRLTYLAKQSVSRKITRSQMCDIESDMENELETKLCLDDKFKFICDKDNIASFNDVFVLVGNRNSRFKINFDIDKFKYFELRHDLNEY